MTITIVCDILGEENNGTTIACMNLIRFLRAQGHTVRVVCADQDKAGNECFYVVPEPEPLSRSNRSWSAMA